MRRCATGKRSPAQPTGGRRHARPAPRRSERRKNAGRGALAPRAWAILTLSSSTTSPRRLSNGLSPLGEPLPLAAEAAAAIARPGSDVPAGASLPALAAGWPAAGQLCPPAAAASGAERATARAPKRRRGVPRCAPLRGEETPWAWRRVASASCRLSRQRQSRSSQGRVRAPEAGSERQAPNSCCERPASTDPSRRRARPRCLMLLTLAAHCKRSARLCQGVSRRHFSRGSPAHAQARRRDGPRAPKSHSARNSAAGGGLGARCVSARATVPRPRQAAAHGHHHQRCEPGGARRSVAAPSADSRPGGQRVRPGWLAVVRESRCPSGFAGGPKRDSQTGRQGAWKRL